MTPFAKKVAIVGAGGTIGKHFVEELLKTGQHEITALTREGSNLALDPSVTITPVNYDDEAQVIQALDGHQFLIITLPVTAPPGTHTKIVSAATKAGIRWIMPNAYGFDFSNQGFMNDIPAATGSLNHCKEVEQMGASYIAMVCSFWYEWSLGLGEPLFGLDIKTKKAVFFDDGKTKINSSTWRQCGRAVAALLSLPEHGDVSLDTWRNKQFYISSFKVSQREMLDSIHRVTGSSDVDWEISYQKSEERYKQGMQDMQKGDHMGFARAMYSRVFYPNGDGDFEARRGLDNESLGLRKEDMDEATKRTVEMVEAGYNPW